MYANGMEAGDNLLPSGVPIPAQAANDNPSGSQVATDDPLLSNAESMSQDESQAGQLGGDLEPSENEDDTNVVRT